MINFKLSVCRFLDLNCTLITVLGGWSARLRNFLDTLGGIGYNFSLGLMEMKRDLGTQLVQLCVPFCTKKSSPNHSVQEISNSNLIFRVCHCKLQKYKRIFKIDKWIFLQMCFPIIANPRQRLRPKRCLGGFIFTLNK